MLFQAGELDMQDPQIKSFYYSRSVRPMLEQSAVVSILSVIALT